MELMNHEAEVGFLAGVLRHPEAYLAINAVGVTSDDLIGRENRIVMEAVERVVAENKVPDQAMTFEELRNASAVTETYISKLLVMAPSIPQAAEHATVVKGLSTARKLVVAGQNIIEAARDARSDYETAMGAAESELRKVRDTMPVPDRSPDPADIIRRLRSTGPERGIPIRFLPTLQDLSGGLIPGHLWVVGGFSSVGKSSVAANIMADCMYERRWVGLISTEMTQENYGQRLIALLSGVPFRDVRDRAFLGLEQIESVRMAEQQLGRSSLRIFDNVYRLSDIRLKAKIMKETTGLDVLIVDFLQNVRGSTGDFSFSDLTEITLDLQQLAKDLKCTVIGMSQLSNEMAKYQVENNDENYYAFKGSGAIKDASDFALMLRRDRVKQSTALTITVLKNRHGELKTIPALIDLPTGRIKEVEPEFIDD